MINPVSIIDEILQVIPNVRTREIIVRRFGLSNGGRQTLEAIGKNYGITRERVRQIQDSGLGALNQSAVKAKLEPIFETMKNHLEEHGQLKREDRLYDDLAYVCYPAKDIERLIQEGKEKELDRCRAAFYLILTLGDEFERVPEDDHFYPVWTIGKDSLKTAKKTVDSLAKHLDTKKQVLKDHQIYEIVKSMYPELSDKAVYSYIDASKKIEKNHLGYFGLAHWPEISPRGVKDKAYIILKNAGAPLHFSDVTKMINESLPSNRQAYVQTVHNELIKDPRFVLVGRGLYALAEWGYEPGTVAETISQILKKEGPLNKEDVVKKVLQKRMVKENTILINLQNKKMFERDAEGKYKVRGV